jgi:predicted NAD/FAD-dependent oxidoreductase
MSTSTEAAELAGIIGGKLITRSSMSETADAILAAGYSKPRTITAVEELDALTVDSVVKDHVGDIWERKENSESERALWCVPGIRGYLPSGTIPLPATVLFDPEAGK